MISTRSLISESSCPCINPLVAVPKAAITIDIIVTFMSNSFFHFLGKVQLRSPLFIFFLFYSAGTAKFLIRQDLFFLLIITWSYRLALIRWSVCRSKSQRSVCVLFSRTDSGLWLYHFFERPNLNFLHTYQCITFPTVSSHILFLF